MLRARRMDQVTIVVDVGERRSGIADLLRAAGVEVEERRLRGGDYVVAPGNVVERKTVHDLHRSVATGRIWSQLEEIRRTAHRAWLLVEGRQLDHGQISGAGIRGALLSVIDTGVPVLWSESREDSTRWLHRLAVRQSRRADGDVRWPMRRPRQRPSASPQSLLSSIPGVSPATASRLLETFGSVETIAAKSKRELMAVEGIGDVRARTLIALLETNRLEHRAL